jgi:pantoate--beta-alanine ligase
VLTLEHVDQLRSALSQMRRDGLTVGLVPTMGALHDGHLALVDRARAENGCVVVTVFVNPTQFRPGEDLDKYPRQLARDVELAHAHGADIVFAPSEREVYRPGHSTTVSVARVSETLCGDATLRGREHFDGVATVVAKLLNMVQPDRAYFGEKDAQQLAVIRRMVDDLDMPVEVVGCPTVREADGLAMSSRNAYLSLDERRRATALWRALCAARAAVASGERDAAAVAEAAQPALAELDSVEYFELVDPATMAPVTHIERPVLAAVAARCGDTRLIDNLILEPVESPVRLAGGAGKGSLPNHPHIPQGAAA